MDVNSKTIEDLGDDDMVLVRCRRLHDLLVLQDRSLKKSIQIILSMHVPNLQTFLLHACGTLSRYSNLYQSTRSVSV